ncbi:Malate synthase [Gluconacetobacter diazotrophicus PA1 5]|uniref:malate synthase G n=1 Tax=Gluconacetobacter diazotrophicus TaxID=33996 RepID=UPI000173B0D8|nr:malate synthase G [Gluconacetobacter diazotrophicus]ACI50489.1 Malate synthase [Gluconacetobacter diazotrophicus PA1 5]TWB02780.1 malate synthase [Gluconacetobacter diazotrophicus]
MSRRTIGQLRIHHALDAFVTHEVLPGTGVSADRFWMGLSDIITHFTPKILNALARRRLLQQAVDHLLTAPGFDPGDVGAQIDLLRTVGYLEREPESVSIATRDVDAEIARIAGPQLVVPVTNARYALNAANARWGSLYDAFYGTDAEPYDMQGVPTAGYDTQRGERVIRRVRLLLDEIMPLTRGSHADVARYRVEDGRLTAALDDGAPPAGLRRPAQFAGFQGPPDAPRVVLLRNHGLHLELRFDPTSPIGSRDRAGISDVIAESAISTIMDCEDSVSAVDVEDKIQVYRNWLGLMQGTLTASFRKGGRLLERRLAPDRHYTAPDGTPLVLPGRSLMLIRNVGHHMFTDAIVDTGGHPVPEGVLDAAVTAAIALHDLRGTSRTTNSRTGSIYIVKPKMHGPEEVALSDALFARVERVLGLGPNTIKMGIMDEERRTSANLAACIQAARERVVFINTGFLDRTGDEIHYCMQAGPVVRKADMRAEPWMAAYEQRNVAIGLACGLKDHAQIGKGMWAMPDRMADMMTQKIAHPRAGANTAWVPSPTAATLHALHYHFVDVATVQARMENVPPAAIKGLMTLPLADPAAWSAAERRAELDNNLQGILGYVVRWVDMGIGCSKVPDLDDVGLMEDRATLRISSQHVANWLHHGVVSQDEVRASMIRMAAIVDGQNRDEPGYRPLADNAGGPAFRAASDLVFKGVTQPNGYTESTLHRWRRVAKNGAAAANRTVPELDRAVP